MEVDDLNSQWKGNGLMTSVRDLVGIIYEHGGYKFWHRRTARDRTTFTYHCCQDAAQARDMTKRNTKAAQRDSSRMERFECSSKLTISTSLHERVLTIALQHSYHIPYVDINLSTEVKEYIDEHISLSTPAEIYDGLRHANISGADSVSRFQVYYRWQQSNCGTWRRDKDSWASAQKLLSESEKDDVQFSEFRSGNVRALGIFFQSSIQPLKNSAKELAMDATFGTNHSGMDLYAVLAELDGTGVPLAYCFVDRSQNIKGRETGTTDFEIQRSNPSSAAIEEPKASQIRTDPGALTDTIYQFLEGLRTVYDLNPTFFGVDKDESEIAAVKAVWPKVSVQLCYWHVKRAIKSKLSQAKKTATQQNYQRTHKSCFHPWRYAGVHSQRDGLTGITDMDNANARHVVPILTGKDVWNHQVKRGS
jgi:hypothetical protein